MGRTRSGEIDRRNPFESPNTSRSSLDRHDDASTSGQSEFHLEVYDKPRNLAHRRQISKGSSIDKPNLNIITDLAHPVMPMKADKLKLGETAAKKGRTERNKKAISVVSQYAVPATASPLEPPASQISPSMLHRLVNLRQTSKSQSNARLGETMLKKKQTEAYSQRIPFGITIPQEHAARLEETMTDSALPSMTPITPAIVITPADVVYKQGLSYSQRAQINLPPSSIPSSTLPSQHNKQSQKVYNEKQNHDPSRSGNESAGLSVPDSANSTRPLSQGWWNLMLSPLMRAASVASLKGKAAGQRPPVPPMPFTSERGFSSPISARTDPSLLVSPNDTSPETPRRQGLASARASTWSRWTEWEKERSANESEAKREEASEKGTEIAETPIQYGSVEKQKPGLATEYYHACAVEQVTGRPFFECLNHDCSARLRLVVDERRANPLVLGSPFQSPLRSESTGDRGAVQRGMMSPSRSLGTVGSPQDELSPNELSPNVREANVTQLIRAKPSPILDNKAAGTGDAASPVQADTKQWGTTKPLSQSGSATSNSNNEKETNVAGPQVPQTLIEVKVVREDYPQQPYTRGNSVKEPVPSTVMSPMPISPQGKKSLGPDGAVSLDELKRPSEPMPVASREESRLPQRPAFISADTEYPQLPERQRTTPVTIRDLNERNKQLTLEQKRRRHEKEDAVAKKAGGLWRGRGCFSKSGCMGRGGAEKRAKRRWIAIIICLIILIIIVSIVLAVTLTRKGDSTPIGSQWLNLTGFPPIPTGILTIATPALAASQQQCVQPTTMWSCSVPKEDDEGLNGNSPDQPNFRFEIRFKNGTVASNLTIPLDGSTDQKSTANDPFASENFVPIPTPPNEADQLFMGNTTDNVTVPFNGEQTPFFITFMSSFPVIPGAFNSSSSSTLSKRQDDNSSLTNALPGPDLASDGSAAPATLLPTDPYPSSQPIRLYNRGLQDEHYGFYIYYDKSIFLSGMKLNGTQLAFENSPEIDQDGGCTKEEASVRCTFAQTRFLIRFYTQPNFADLLSSANKTNLQDQSQKQPLVSSATDFSRPGSFPYPAQITLDRHGGDIDKKAAYCYGMDNGQIVKTDKVVVGELRSFGGQLVNPAPSIFGGIGNFSESAGGIDGGTGGCLCTWQNF